MAGDAVAVDERIELIKLLKKYAIASAQVIVQARDGKKAKTQCFPKPIAGHTTTSFQFNLTIREVPEVDREVRRVMSTTHSERWSMCIDIYLKTMDNDIMTLETWNLFLEADYSDFTSSFTVYHRLGTLLKSLCATTRVVPAYRYSRRQSPDSYNIGHKLYAGDPQCNLLGENCGKIHIGSVSTPIGKLHLECHYRTVMTISPQPSGINNSIMVKSDHFRPDHSPKHNREQKSNENSTSLSEDSSYKLKDGAFVESRRESLVPIDSAQLLPDVPFGSLLNNKASLQQSPPSTVNEKELCDRLKAIEFEKQEPNDIVTPVTKSTSSYNDDFIVVDLVQKPPFAESTGNIELGTFYQEWESAPPLQTCPTDPKVIDQVGDLTSQLASYETSLKEFDIVVTSLCEEEEEEEVCEPEASPHFIF